VRPGKLCICLVLGLAASSLFAQQPPPDGIKAGPFILAPYFQAGGAADSNIFLTPEPESDTIQIFTAGLGVVAPFRNSVFQFDYEASRLQFTEHEFSRDVSQEFAVNFIFNFGSKDRLVLRERFVDSFADLSRIDDSVGTGDERFFDGQPYRYNRWDVELSRLVPLQQGYSIRVTRVDLNYTDVVDPIPFQDYRGFDSGYEFRQPLAQRKWLIAYYSQRRFNYYDPNIPELTGVPISKETSDTIQLGLRGLLGKDQPYYFRLGYVDFKFDVFLPGEDQVNRFEGLTGSFSWALSIGGRSSLNLAMARRPLASGFDTFYLNNQVRAEFRRQWRRNSSVGLRGLLSLNQYADEIPGLEACAGIVRRDFRGELEANLDWLIHPKFGFITAASFANRNSNCDIFTYDAVALSVGITAGWF